MPVDSAAEFQVYSSKEAGTLLLLWSENTPKAVWGGITWVIWIRKQLRSPSSTQLAALAQALLLALHLGGHTDHGANCSHKVISSSYFPQHWQWDTVSVALRDSVGWEVVLSCCVFLTSMQTGAQFIARELHTCLPHPWNRSSLPNLCLAVCFSPDLPPAQRQNLCLPFCVWPLWDSRGDGECCSGGSQAAPGSQHLHRRCCGDAQGTRVPAGKPVCQWDQPVQPAASCLGRPVLAVKVQNWALCAWTSPQLSVLGGLRSITTVQLYHCSVEAVL